MQSPRDEDDLSRPISAPRPVASGASTVNHNPLSVRVTDTSIGQFDPRTKPGIKVDDAYSVLNPDLPSRDALYIFVNFISYTRTPKQGSQGVRDEQLKHASRLLDYARVSLPRMRPFYPFNKPDVSLCHLLIRRTSHRDRETVSALFTSNIAFPRNPAANYFKETLVRSPLC